MKSIKIHSSKSSVKFFVWSGFLIILPKNTVKSEAIFLRFYLILDHKKAPLYTLYTGADSNFTKMLITAFNTVLLIACAAAFSGFYSFNGFAKPVG